MHDSTDGQDEGLIRAIGPRALTLNIINMVVGGGIFVLPGLVAVQLGPAAIVAYLICSLAVALVFLCFAETGSRITRSGGAYAYIEEAFGPFAGFMASILLWFGWNVLSNAAIAAAMVEAMAIPFPVLAEPVPRAAFIITLLGVLVLVNIRGVQRGVRLFEFNTVIKLIPLCLLVIVGLGKIEFANLAIAEWPSAEKAGASALLLFFAFAGVETALSSSGEIRDPRKTVPLGLLLGLASILFLYIGLQTVAQGVLGDALADNTESPLAAAAEQVFGGWGGTMLLVTAVVSIYANMSGDMLNTPRVLFASARDGILPRLLASVHPRFRTPHVAIAVFAAMICVFALTGAFRPLAVVASGSILLVYLGVSLATIRLRLRDGTPGPGKFAIPGGPAVPLLSCLVIGWLLLRLTREEAAGLAALCGAAVLLYVAGILARHVARSSGR
jgi:basic amino acid/polyamine antiporter, APA family